MFGLSIWVSFAVPDIVRSGTPFWSANGSSASICEPRIGPSTAGGAPSRKARR